MEGRKERRKEAKKERKKERRKEGKKERRKEKRQIFSGVFLRDIMATHKYDEKDSRATRKHFLVEGKSGSTGF